MLISSRRTGRIPSDVQKRRLPSRAAAGPESLRGQNQAGRPAEPTRTPMKTDLNPHGTVNGRGAAYCKRIASLVHWTGRRLPRRRQSREVIDHMVVSRANARRTPSRRGWSEHHPDGKMTHRLFVIGVAVSVRSWPLGAVLQTTPNDALAWLSRHGHGNLGAYLGRQAAALVKSLLAEVIQRDRARLPDVRPVATGGCP
jgi:hypothetical protein